MTMKSSNEIAIIGVGGVFPDAHDAATYWQNITSGHVALRDVSDDRWEASLFYSKDRQEPDKTYSKIGGFVGVPPFDRKMFKIAPKVVEQMAKDVVSFLMWTAEPHLEQRHKIGFRAIVYLIILSVLVYFSMKKIWSRIETEV